jgi:hypothetical protein
MAFLYNNNCTIEHFVRRPYFLSGSGILLGNGLVYDKWRIAWHLAVNQSRNFGMGNEASIYFHARHLF